MGDEFIKVVLVFKGGVKVVGVDVVFFLLISMLYVVVGYFGWLL